MQETVKSTSWLLKQLHELKNSQKLFSALLFLHALLITVYLISNSFTGRGFEESVIYLVYTGVEGLELEGYRYLIFSTGLLLLLALYLCIKAPNYWQTYHQLSANFKGGINLVLIVFLVAQPVSVYLFINSPLFNSMISLYKPDIRFTEPADIRLTSKPNLVFIYLEGFERTFLNEKVFPGLAPNLKQLESEALSFNNIREVYGTRWTIAGMVASQCGLPLLPVANANKPGTFMPKAVCIGDVLHDNGYYQAYIGGASMRFGGKGNFYSTHRFDSIEGRDELIGKLPESTPLTQWGLYDDKLFELALNKLEQIRQLGKPYALFMLSLDTHPPEGYPSPSCDGIQYQKGEEPTLNAVHCSDLLVGNLIKNIMASPDYNNTYIVVTSDHLSLSHTASDQLNELRRRNLLFVLGKDIAGSASGRYGSPLDIAPTLLSIMGNSVNEFNLGVNLQAEIPTLVESLITPDYDLRIWSTRLQDFY